MAKQSRKRKLELLTEAIGEQVRIGRVREFPALFIGDRLITEGTEEVNKRIDVLIREYGLQFED